MTKREQMLECIEEIENRQDLVEGHDIWQDELVWWMAKAICLLLREAAIADRDEVRAPSEPVLESTGRADAQRGAGRWIPVSESLPGYGEDVLLSIGGVCSVGHCVPTNSGGVDWYYNGWYHPECDVDAWMPLPEPWEGK